MIKGNPQRLTIEEERELAKRARAGEIKARQIMIECNIPLALKEGHRCRFGMVMLGRDDVDGFALIALCKAVDHFDPSCGFRLSSYIGATVFKEVYRAAQLYGRSISIPLYLQKTITKLDKGYPITLEEESRLDLILAARVAMSNIVNLDERDLGFYEDDQVPLEEIHRAVSSLKDSEAWLIRARWLPEDGYHKTYREIARELDISIERARLLMRRAEESLKALLQSSENVLN